MGVAQAGLDVCVSGYGYDYETSAVGLWFWMMDVWLIHFYTLFMVDGCWIFDTCHLVIGFKKF